MGFLLKDNVTGLRITGIGSKANLGNSPMDLDLF